MLRIGFIDLLLYRVMKLLNFIRGDYQFSLINPSAIVIILKKLIRPI